MSKTTYLSCSNCRRKLVDICTTEKFDSEGNPFRWKVQAKCCFCKDKSFVEVVEGVFRYCGYARAHPDYPDDLDMRILETSIGTITQVNDVDGIPITVFDTVEVK